MRKILANIKFSKPLISSLVFKPFRNLTEAIQTPPILQANTIKSDPQRIKPSTFDQSKEPDFNQNVLSNSQVISKFEESNFPYSLTKKTERKTIKKEYDNLILDKRYPLEKVQANLLEILNKYIQSLHTNNNFPKMEHEFLLKTQTSLNTLKNNNYKVILKKNQEETESVQIIEINHLIGVSTVRSQNYSFKNYIINNALETNGIILYYPGKVEGEENELDIVGYRKKAKQFVLRVHVQHKTGYQIQIEKPNNEVIVQQNNLVHYAIFENQLRNPPALSQIHLEMVDWFKNFRLAEWVLVDYDEAMKGNRIVSIDKTLLN